MSYDKKMFVVDFISFYFTLKLLCIQNFFQLQTKKKKRRRTDFVEASVYMMNKLQLGSNVHYNDCS